MMEKGYREFRPWEVLIADRKGYFSFTATARPGQMPSGSRSA